MPEADKEALTEIVATSGLHRRTMEAGLLDQLMTSVTISEQQLSQLLRQYPRAAGPSAGLG
jgi:hypothetical protein